MTLRESYHAYELPLSPEAITRVISDNLSHIGPYEGSIDYAVALGTPVLAAADGIVTRIRENSEQYGDDPSFGPAVNFITLDHGNEFSEYLHLEKDSVQVRCGQHVRTGQVLARAGCLLPIYILWSIRLQMMILGSVAR